MKPQYACFDMYLKWCYCTISFNTAFTDLPNAMLHAMVSIDALICVPFNFVKATNAFIHILQECVVGTLLAVQRPTSLDNSCCPILYAMLNV